MCSLSAAICIWMVLQISQVVHAGQFRIIPPPNPIIGFLGKDVNLPCQLTTSSIPDSQGFTVRWMFDNSSEKHDVMFYDSRRKEETQEKRYQGQVELFHSELRKGNMSLNLKNSQLSDQGKYTCMVNLENWYDEVVVELNVIAKGEEPSISLELYKGHGIGLTCSSKGWYPKAQALWMDSKGKNRTEKPETTSTETPDGTFNIFSSITIEPGVDNEVSCKIINSVLQLESESRILISDVFYPTTSAWLPPFIIILILTLGIILFMLNKLRESNKKASQSETRKNYLKAEHERLQNAVETERMTRQASVAELQERLDRVADELAFRRAQSYAAALTLDPDFKLRKAFKRAFSKQKTEKAAVAISGTLLEVAKEGYCGGKHYWPVEVGDGINWELGVMTEAERDKAQKKKHEKPLGEGTWSLKCIGGDFFSNQSENKIDKKDVSYSSIGIFLDQDKKQISFYNADVMFLIQSIPIQSTEKLYPFFRVSKAAETPVENH